MNPSPTIPLRIGLLADVHHADKEPENGRHFRASAAKTREAVDRFIAERADLLIDLGDLVDSSSTTEQEIDWLLRINEELKRFPGERLYITGNHCLNRFNRSQYAELVEGQVAPGSFNRGGWHFVLLDTCYRQDGRPYSKGNFDWRDAALPASQMDWLLDDLKHAGAPAVVFCHHRLDDPGAHGIKNAAAVRAVLESAGNVRAVIQGHQHTAARRDINGIAYITLRSVVDGPLPEDSGYAVLQCPRDGGLHLQGFRAQPGHTIPAPAMR